MNHHTHTQETIKLTNWKNKPNWSWSFEVIHSKAKRMKQKILNMSLKYLKSVIYLLIQYRTKKLLHYQTIFSIPQRSPKKRESDLLHL